MLILVQPLATIAYILYNQLIDLTVNTRVELESTW